MNLLRRTRRVARFLRATAARKRLVLACVWQLARASVQLRVVPETKLVALLGEAAPAGSAVPAVNVERQARATDIGATVEYAARVLPWHPTCLRQALAAHRILERAGIPHVMELGVTDAQTLGAHAWVSAGDLVVVGGAGRSGHTPVACFVFGDVDDPVSRNTAR